MKSKKTIFFYLIWVVFFLYGIDNYVFERKFFFNELLSLVGIIFASYFFVFSKEKPKLSRTSLYIFRALGMLLLLCLVHLVVSLTRMTSLYFYLRNSVIFYSIFTFFVGFFAFPYLEKFLEKTRPILWAYFIFALVFPAQYLLERFMGAVFFPLLFKNYKWQSLIGIILLSAALSVRYESLTVIMVLVLALFILFLPSYKWFKISFFTGLICLLVGFCYFAPNLNKYKEAPYSVTGNIEAVAESHPLLNLDGNSTWRAVFWYRITVERFPENIAGIGFGTPLLPYIKGLDTIPVSNDDEHDMHVTGAHNTYLTLAIRLGLVFLILISFVFHYIFRYFYRQKQLLKQKNQIFFFYSFFTVSAVGFFNLVLESPTGASLFWGFLGITTAIIQQHESATTVST